MATSFIFFMTIPKIKKGWIITIVPLIVIMVLNPSFASFKEFTTDYKNKDRVIIQKRVSNYLLFSVYEKQILDFSNDRQNPTITEDEKYVGFVLNFFDITKNTPVPAVVVASNTVVVDTSDKVAIDTVSIDEVNKYEKKHRLKKGDNPFDYWANVSDSINYANKKHGTVIGYTSDGLPIFKK